MILSSSSVMIRLIMPTATKNLNQIPLHLINSFARRYMKQKDFFKMVNISYFCFEKNFKFYIKFLPESQKKRINPIETRTEFVNEGRNF